MFVEVHEFAVCIEAVEGNFVSLFFFEEVNHQVKTSIEDGPAYAFLVFNADIVELASLEFLGEFIQNGLHLGFTFASGDEEIVRFVFDAAESQNQNYPKSKTWLPKHGPYPGIQGSWMLGFLTCYNPLLPSPSGSEPPSPALLSQITPSA